MPRQARIDAPGAVHHVIVRGIERRKIFLDDQDRSNWIARLGKILIENRTPCFAWALISNHVHLLLRTGLVPLSTVMQRLLTGYAVSFNRRHKRHGQLFQNRYKSILCQEDPYLRELVGYIHLNPLRAGLVKDIAGLDFYPSSGHSALMGHQDRPWQDTVYVLRLFSERKSTARRRYREFVEKEISKGQRPELVGGGLIRSLGGWQPVKLLRKRGQRIKGDERILGDSSFVGEVLTANQDELERKAEYRQKGYDFNWLVDRVARLLEMNMDEVLTAGRYPQTVKARSILLYWAHRELGISTVELARRVNLSQPSVSQSIRRGEKLISENGYELLPKP
jgi:REP element-mobilizing transposase RayT